jgi:streptogramin lyase
MKTFRSSAVGSLWVSLGKARRIVTAVLFAFLGSVSFRTEQVLAQEFFLVPSGSTDNILRYSDSGAFLGAFVASGSGGLNNPRAVISGPDGNIYVSQGTGPTDPIRRYDGHTGEFIDIFASQGGISPFGIVFGPDGHLYAASFSSNNVVRFNGVDGHFMGTFTFGASALAPRGLVFGPDGHLYVSSPGNASVLRYDGSTGQFMGVFASNVDARGLVFGPDGHLYVASFNNDRVLRFNGTDGSPMGTFASGGGLDGPVGVGFGPDGNLYVGSFNNHRILRYSGKTGAFMDVFVSPGSGGLNQPRLFTTVLTPAANRTLRSDVELVASNDAFEFNGIDDAMVLGHSRILDLVEGDFTVHAWVNFTSLRNEGPCFDPGCDMSIVDKMASFFDANDDGWRLLKQSDNRFYFCLGGGSSGNGCQDGVATTVVSQTVAVPGVWYSVAAVKSGGNISIYVNGESEAASTFGAFADRNAADLLVGANNPEGAFLAGRVGQVELFRRGLSNAQVRALYVRSKAKYGR